MTCFSTCLLSATGSFPLLRVPLKRNLCSIARLRGNSHKVRGCYELVAKIATSLPALQKLQKYQCLSHVRHYSVVLICSAFESDLANSLSPDMQGNFDVCGLIPTKLCTVCFSICLQSEQAVSRFAVILLHCFAQRDKVAWKGLFSRRARNFEVLRLFPTVPDVFQYQNAMCTQFFAFAAHATVE